MIARVSWSARAQLAAAAGCALAGGLAYEQHRAGSPFFLLAAMFLPLSVVLSTGAATLALLAAIGLPAAHANGAANGASDTATGLALVLYARALLLVVLRLRHPAERPVTVPDPASVTVPAPRAARRPVAGDRPRRRPRRAILSLTLTLTVGLITTCMVTFHLRRRRSSSAPGHLTGHLDA